MSPLDLKETLAAAYKLNDWLNFYWNFYVVFTGVVIGWVFNSKATWPVSQRVIVSVFYLGFVAVSLGALMKTYQSLNAVSARVQVLLPKDDLTEALVTQLSNPDWKLQIALHVIGDALVLACVWLFTKKPADASTPAPR